MAVFIQSITVANVLAGLTTDTTKWAGANIANCDYLLSSLSTDLLKTVYCNDTFTWSQAADGAIDVYTAPPLSAIVGTWIWKLQFTTNGNSGDSIGWDLIRDAGTDRYEIQQGDQNGGNFPHLKEYTTALGMTTLVQRGSANTGTAEHIIRVTRDTFSNMELFYDGASIGTAVSTLYPTGVESTIYSMRDSAGGSIIDTKELYHTRLMV